MTAEMTKKLSSNEHIIQIIKNIWKTYLLSN